MRQIDHLQHGVTPAKTSGCPRLAQDSCAPDFRRRSIGAPLPCHEPRRTSSTARRRYPHHTRIATHQPRPSKKARILHACRKLSRRTSPKRPGANWGQLSGDHERTSREAVATAKTKGTSPMKRWGPPFGHNAGCPPLVPPPLVPCQMVFPAVLNDAGLLVPTPSAAPMSIQLIEVWG